MEKKETKEAVEQVAAVPAGPSTPSGRFHKGCWIECGTGAGTIVDIKGKTVYFITSSGVLKDWTEE